MQSLTYDLKEDDALYFLHIPKTAGMSLISILDNHFDYDSILPESTWQELWPTLPRDFSKYRLIRGHFGYGIHRILPKRPIFMTMLREPIERTISDYEHMKRDPVTPTLENYFSEKRDISDFLKDDSLNWRLTNNQIRHIGLDRDVMSPKYSAVNTGLGKIAPTRSLEYKLNDDPSDESLLDVAKQRLLKFPFFGITERFYDSMLLFAYTFGFRPNTNFNKKNVSSNRKLIGDLPKTTIELLQNCTKLDRELYAYGKELFDSRFTKMIDDLEEKYANRQIENMPFQDKLIEMLHKNHNDRRNNADGLDSVEYDFRQKLEGSGWEAREFSPNGIAFRWTGPDSISSIYFLLKRNKDKKLRFRVISAITQDILKSLKVKVDDNLVSHRQLTNFREERVFESIVPKIDEQEKRFTKITFQVDHTTSPSSIHPNSRDDRLLGIAINWIRLF